MSVKKSADRREVDRMPDRTFKMMNFLFKVVDAIYPYIDTRVKSFGIHEGMTVVDYGCGPGRYTTRFSKLVGERGRVYAVDIHELAIAEVRKKVSRLGLNNVEPILGRGYDSGLPDHVADVTCAIDMFFGIKKPTQFLEELKRITKEEGILIIDDGHQSRAETKRKIEEAGCWRIIEETKDHLKCKPE